MHNAELSAEDNPLNSSSAFAAFRAALADRAAEGQVPRDAPVVGSYRLL